MIPKVVVESLNAWYAEMGIWGSSASVKKNTRAKISFKLSYFWARHIKIINTQVKSSDKT